MKRILKILSVVLTVVLLIGIFSCATPVFAAEVSEKDRLNSTMEQYKAQVEDLKNKNLYEIKEERDEFTKIFKNNDGTKTAIVSATPIHYKTGEGWEDIDNTLIEERKVTGSVYKNKKNNFSVTIPQEITSSKELTIEKEDYKISFELEGSDLFSNSKKIKGNKKNKKIKSYDKQNEIYTDFLDKTSAFYYENVGENTSLEYEVTSTGLKENIILTKRPEKAVVYKYKITAKKLEAQLNADNSVTFKNTEGQAIFEIPAPIMYDSENRISRDIKVEFSGENGKYTLIYKPSFEWLSSGLTYPVVIDPVINSTDENLSVKDVSVDSANSTKNYGNDENLYTYKSETGDVLSYIDLASNYLIDSGIKIKSVLLNLYYTGGLFIDNNTTVAAYTVTSQWNENNVKYTNKPTTSNIIDKIDINKDTLAMYLTFDVTKAYTLKEDTYGVCIRQSDSVSSEALLIFASSESSITSEQPFFIVEYYETQGVEEQFDYHAFDVGRAGKAYFNDFSEQVYIERDELGLSGINMPVQIKRYFNSGLGGTYSSDYIELFGEIGYYGFGWRTNYNQSIEYQKNIDGNETIIYCNGNGQTTYFAKTETVDSDNIRTWEEVPDKFSASEGYTLYLGTQYDNSVGTNLDKAVVKDSNGQTYEFNAQGFLIKINSAETDSPKNITITYAEYDYKIQKITDGVGREYRFSYTEYEEWFFPLLTSIQAFSPSGQPINVSHKGVNVPYKITYTYDFSDCILGEGLPMLASATYPDGETVRYTINNNFISLKNIDGYAIEFSFNENNTVISERVYSNNETDFTNGGQLIITDENSYEKSFVDLNAIKITKQFDMYGRTINVINESDSGSSVARTYSDDYKAQGLISYSFYNSYEQEVAEDETNLITNGSFTTNLNGWTLSNTSNVKRASGYDCKTDNETQASLKISGVHNNIHYATQTINVENGVSGDEYRLDYFTKNSAYSHMLVEAGYFNTVLVEARNNIAGDETWETIAWVDINPFNENWQKYSYGFDIDFEYNEIKVTLVYYFQYGTVYFDDVSLVNTYKATANRNSETENENTDTGDGTLEGIGCDCEGCITPDCPCVTCSENCTLPYCNRGYSFENNSQGISFSMTDGEKTMGMEQNVNGNYYGNQFDLNGIYTGYSYNQMNGQLNAMSDHNGQITNFSYDAMSRLNKVSNTVDGLTNGITMETSYSYEKDKIKSITHNNFSYNYEYDVWGNPTAVKIGEQALVSYTYDSDNRTRDRLNRITYGNGDYTDYAYNNAGYIETIKSYSADGQLVAHYLYSYGDYGQIQSIKNLTENTAVVYTDKGMTFNYLNTDSGTIGAEIYSTSVNNFNETVENIGVIGYTETKGEVESDAESGTSTVNTVMQFDDSTKYTYTTTSRTDYFGRNQMDKFSMLYDYEDEYELFYGTETEYGYKDIVSESGQSEKTTSLVNSYKNTLCYDMVATDESNFENDLFEGDQLVVDEYEYLYEYDGNGNITKVSLKTFDEENVETISELQSYAYDNVGQLVRENNSELNKTFVYVYDKGGNIARKVEYAYTTEGLGEPVSNINYSYDSVWKDKLVGYDGNQIETDSMGNPLNYVYRDHLGETNSGTLEWNGRQLTAVNVNGIRYEYSYNSDGLRTSVKTYDKNGTIEDIQYYIWQNGKLMGYFKENIAGNSDDTSVKFLYDNNDNLIGMRLVNRRIHYDKILFFRKNLQGDIQSVYDSLGNQVLAYTYDAWGNINVTANTDSVHSSLSASMAFDFVPITYRGYLYDVNTGLYYLQSRYYNPTYGRFLNADATEILEATQGTPLGANLFAYCNNNPVNRVDRTGYLSIYEQNEDGSYRGWVGIGIQLSFSGDLPLISGGNGCDYIYYFPENNFGRSYFWGYPFTFNSYGAKYDLKFLIAGVFNPLLVFAGIGASMGVSVCVSVFLVFADRLVDENSYLGYFATKQFYVGVGYVTVATDGISNIKTFGYGSYLGLSATAPSTGFGYAGFYAGWAYYNAII